MRLLWGLLAVVMGQCALAEPPAAKSDLTARPWLAPYEGPTRGDVDATTLDGKVLCGYQGWFNTPGDGTPFGFGHWGSGLENPGGTFGVDMWPDVSEYDAADLAAVPGVTMLDGSPAKLYSGFKPGPTLVHFRWMREHGIDGVFLSRFVGETLDPARARHVNQVLANVRAGAHREGRVWAMMLDLSMGEKQAKVEVVKRDWEFLCDHVGVREDARYLRYEGKPVVLLWGLGFRDRPWTAAQAKELIEFFRSDPKYGGVYLIGGVDPSWRTLKGDSRTEPEWAEVYRMFDAISPWNTGRFADNAGMDRHRKSVWEKDLQELKGLKKGYMPVAFPGFSWDNMHNAKPGATMIARRKGEFFWRQLAIYRELGIRTVMVGMFDEVNEGTAIYKVSSAIPKDRYFVTYEGMPADWYLRLTGEGARMIRGERELTWTIPISAEKK